MGAPRANDGVEQLRGFPAQSGGSFWMAHRTAGQIQHGGRQQVQTQFWYSRFPQLTTGMNPALMRWWSMGWRGV